MINKIDLKSLLFSIENGVSWINKLENEILNDQNDEIINQLINLKKEVYLFLEKAEEKYEKRDKID